MNFTADDIKQLAKNRANSATKGGMHPIGNLSNGKSKYKVALSPEQVKRHADIEDAKNRINLGYDDEGDPFFD